MSSIKLSTVALLLIFMLCGCSSQFPPPESRLSPAEASFDVPPKQMVQIIRDVCASLSLPIESQQDGVLVSGYQDFPGELHIVRRWQEQTRYKITIIPDWQQPTEKCKVQVTEETEQRATGSQPWQPAPEVNRSDRSQKLLQRILQAAAKH